ncbi:MAG: large-conductance mechanosensitive channel protein MscL [Clostridia bacterium]|nr:large-conductance mechanosensitive channel protein MscL [Clostridia bacterium]
MAKDKNKKGFFTEFKEFISKGSIIDMAVGVIVGGAFKDIVNSLVADIIMPIVGKIIGTKSISDLKWVITEAVPADEANGVAEVAEVAVKYGAFIQHIIDFIIIALCLFVVIKTAMNFRKNLEALKKKEEEAPAEEAAPAEPTIEEKNAAVLAEIRDLLKEQAKK